MTNTPSAVARRTFAHVVWIGDYVYQAGYRQSRSSFESYLIMVVLHGGLDVWCDDGTADGCHARAGAGQFVVLDCRPPHSYGTDEETELLWVHCDGPMVKGYVDLIVGAGHPRMTPVVELRDPTYAIARLRALVDSFISGPRLSEARVGRLLVDVLTECADARLSEIRDDSSRAVAAAQDAVDYIASHLDADLRVEDLAERAFMSKSQFTAAFRKVTGLSPHAYVLEARMRTASYLLTRTDRPIGHIMRACGYADASVFGAAFRKRMGQSPREYRKATRQNL
ncbi:AraC family transcriptional regulator [Bifidobacterium eulemuris]|nr:AraC family transcriptional regulator [Bifidobacterium eulemuris]